MSLLNQGTLKRHFYTIIKHWKLVRERERDKEILENMRGREGEREREREREREGETERGRETERQREEERERGGEGEEDEVTLHMCTHIDNDAC